MASISINQETCKKDGLCTMVCPEAVLVQSEKGSIPRIVHVEECIACGQCASVCPAGALQHADFPAEKLIPLDTDLQPSFEQLSAAILSRRSMRAFRETPVEKEIIEKIIDMARYSPSARNSQSSAFIVIQEPETLKKIIELTITFQRRAIKEDPDALTAFKYLSEAYDEGKDRILHDARALLLIHGPVIGEFPEVNAALAAQNSALAAHSLGLESFFTGYVVAASQNDDAIPDFLGLPNDRRLYAGLALGYPRVKFKRRMERRPASIRWI